jgi:hypothetical protein
MINDHLVTYTQLPNGTYFLQFELDKDLSTTLAEPTFKESAGDLIMFAQKSVITKPHRAQGWVKPQLSKWEKRRLELTKEKISELTERGIRLTEFDRATMLCRIYVGLPALTQTTEELIIEQQKLEAKLLKIRLRNQAIKQKRQEMKLKNIQAHHAAMQEKLRIQKELKAHEKEAIIEQNRINKSAKTEKSKLKLQQRAAKEENKIERLTSKTVRVIRTGWKHSEATIEKMRQRTPEQRRKVGERSKAIALSKTPEMRRAQTAKAQQTIAEKRRKLKE